MEIARQEQYLVLSYDRQSREHCATIYSDFIQSMSGWNNSTRISPIWPVLPFNLEVSGRFDFPRKGYLFFLGPIDPFHLNSVNGSEKWSNADIRLWLSHGLYNAVIYTSSTDIVLSLTSYVCEQEICFEVWHLSNGLVTEWHCHTNSSVSEQTKPLPSGLITNPELEPSFQTFSVLHRTGCSRAQDSCPVLLPTLLKAQRFISAILDKRVEDPESVYEAQGILTYLNAALSRFLSQALSGTSPIFHTTSHFASHSLLGIGSANVALYNLSSFIINKLGVRRIAQYVEEYSKVKASGVDLTCQRLDSPYLARDHLQEIVQDRAVAQDDLLCPITYFSGRDGFRSHLCTLSAPLSVLNGCNSPAWSLLTITHELSHMIMATVLSSIFPSLRVQNDVYRCLEILSDQEHVTNKLDEVARYLFTAIASMECAEKDEDSNDKDYSVPYFVSLLTKWRAEAEEIMVHVFDFLYFYRQDEDKYIKGIWLSWSTIPNIGHRVPEYLIRTICAILPKYLDGRPSPEVSSRERVESVLSSLSANHPQNTYIVEALSFLRREWEYIEKLLIARRPLVRIVRSFLYSDEIMRDLWNETCQTAGHKEVDGYPLPRLRFIGRKFDNPLRFLEVFTQDTQPSSAVSLWMLQMLAFAVAGAEP